jgi:hypothetical protein
MGRAVEKILDLTPKLIAVALVLWLVTGCGLLEPPKTATPIFVTATPLPVTPSEVPPTVESTPLFGPTVDVAGTAVVQFAAPTSTPTPQDTKPPSLTPSFTITYTETPESTRRAVSVATCTSAPSGGFATIFSRDPALQQALGCAVSGAIPINSATQDFESGRMIWASQLGEIPREVIYAVYNSGTYQRYDDTWVEGVDPMAPADSPPAGRNVPARGFGKVWSNNPAVKNGLGWALNTEFGTGAQMQRFERGEMIYIASLNQTYVFIGGGSWRLDTTPF